MSILKPIITKNQIKEEELWNRYSVRDVCIKHDLYTHGTIEEYENMLSYVDENNPEIMSIYYVAKDILNHSEGQTITNIMFVLSNEAVQRFYEVSEED